MQQYYKFTLPIKIFNLVDHLMVIGQMCVSYETFPVDTNLAPPKETVMVRPKESVFAVYIRPK